MLYFSEDVTKLREENARLKADIVSNQTRDSTGSKLNEDV